MQRPAPLPWTFERDRMIRRRAAIIGAVGLLVFGAPLAINLWPAARAVADILGLH